MTRTDLMRALIPVLLILILPFGGGCNREVEPFPEPGGVSESSDVVRDAQRGCIVVTYASYPLRNGAPPDGVRLAMTRSLGNIPCSAASFYWTERPLAMRWLQEQLEMRRRRGEIPRVLLAGHGLGATEAAETARELLAREQDVQIVLLLTVDAVKTGRINSAAGVTGNAIVTHLPGVNYSFTAYDSAPSPDGKRLWSHVNYYQDKTPYYHGTAMPGADNHLLIDWTGLLNHGNSDDFAMPMIAVDFRQALERGSR